MAHGERLRAGGQRIEREVAIRSRRRRRAAAPISLTRAPSTGAPALFTTRPKTRAVPFATRAGAPRRIRVRRCDGERRDAHAPQREQPAILRDRHFGRRAAVLALRLQLALVLLGQPAQPIGAVLADGGLAHARRLLDLDRHAGHGRRIGSYHTSETRAPTAAIVAVRLADAARRAHRARARAAPACRSGQRGSPGSAPRSRRASRSFATNCHRRRAQRDPERVEDRMVDEHLVAARLDAVDEEAPERVGDADRSVPSSWISGADQRLAVNAVDRDALQVPGRSEPRERTGRAGRRAGDAWSAPRAWGRWRGGSDLGPRSRPCAARGWRAGALPARRRGGWRRMAGIYGGSGR